MESQGSSEPHSCQHCQQLIFYLDKSSAEAANDFEIFEDGRAQLKKCAVETHNSESVYYLQLEVSCYHFSRYIASGCKFFELLSSTVPEDRPYYVRGDEELVVVVQIDPTHVKFGTLARPHGRSHLPNFQLYDNLNFAILTKQGNPASHWIGKGPNNIIPSSNESFHMVHGWLQTCLDSHELCVKPEIGFMPARLIKILENGGQFALRLQEKESGISHQYAALSYCWGGEQSLQTTTHNHARHQIEIDFDDLPPTLRDAVLTTHKLGLQYLWVDALCIIQDDERDKSSEIDIMSHVYTSAVVTIAASRAKSVQEGFLQDRSPHIRNNPIEFEMLYRCPDGQVGNITLVSAEDIPAEIAASDQGDTRVKEPLSTRGWAFQERLSSTRLLEYGTFRTHWLCRTRCTSDRYSHSYDDYQLKLLWRDRFVVMGLPDLPNIDILEEAQKAPKSLFGTREQLPDIPNLEILAGMQKWSHSVDTFTHKQLTFQSDRLAAIAGVARRYQPIFKDDYLAGIWKSPLPYGLLWIVDTFAITSFEKRPEHYLAPSWSWAAVIQPVSTRVFDSSGSPVVQILDAKVDSNSTPAKYGAVREGQLKLRGFLTNATWTCSNYTNDIYSLGTMYADQGSHSTKYREMATHPDALETDLWDTDTHSISVYLLVLLVDAKVERVTGLILRKHEDGVYSRLGVFQSPCNDHGVKNNPNEARKFLQRQEQIVTIK